MMEKGRVSLTEILSDIRAGFSDSELLDKHGLTPEELKAALDELVESGELSGSEVDAQYKERNDMPSSPPHWQRKAALRIIGGIAIGSVIFILGNNRIWFSIFQTLSDDAHFAVRLASFFFPFLLLMGTGLLIWGCYFLAKGKGYHGAWGILGLFCCIGVPILLLLPNKVVKNKPWSPLKIVLACGAFIGFILAITIPYHIAYKRTSCDRAAEADAKKPLAAFERLANELEDRNCDYKNWKVTESQLRHMVGPYYGFRGGTTKCDVRFRVEGDAIEVCAGKGSHPAGWDSRYIYRLRARLGAKQDLPPMIGPCGGFRLPTKTQGFEECFIETIVSGCSYRFERKPRGTVNADVVRACEERRVKAPTQQRQNSRSLATDVINVFSSDLYRKLAHDDHNLLFSPLSVFIPLVMAYEGARGPTRAEMAAVLHVDKAKVPLHPTLGALVSDLDCSVASADGILLMANALWGQKDYGFTEEYQDLLRTHYGSEIKEVNYRSPDAEKTVNQWIAHQTQGKITEMVKLDAREDTLTRLLTANAVYFNCAWATKFPMESTKDDKFTLLDNSKIMVPMMRTESTGFGYMSKRDFQAVELQYDGGELSMVVVLPRKTDGLLELEKSFTGESLSRWSGSLPPWRAGVHVFLPKFYIQRRFELSEILKAMGMKLAFSKEIIEEEKMADFTGISGPRPSGHRLRMAGTVHQAGIDVHEEGTEAWAATVNCKQITVGDFDSDPTKPVVFRADHPFMFMIRHNPSDAVLFMGRVTNPME